MALNNLWVNSNIIPVNHGTYPNDGTGDSIQLAFTKVDNTFSNISNFLGGYVNGTAFPNLDIEYNLNTANFFAANATGTNATFAGNITANTLISTLGANIGGNLVVANIVPVVSGQYDLGSPTYKFRNLYLSGVTIQSAGAQTIDAGQLIIHANATVGDVKDVGIIGNVSHHYPANAYAFFGYQYLTNNFVYKIAPTNAADFTTGGNSVIYNGVYGNVQFGSQLLSNTTPSTNTSTGALIVSGGAGIAGTVNVGGNVNAGYLNATNGVFSNGPIVTNTGNVLTTGTVGAFNLFQGGIVLGNVFVTSPYDAITQSNAALVVSGGIGVGANVFAGGFIGPYYGTLQSANQPNITSVGTLNNLNIASGGYVRGNVQATTVGTTYLTVSGGVIDATTSTIETNALYVSGVFSATSLSAATIGNVGATLVGTNGYVSTINANNVLASNLGNVGTTLTGTIATANQPNITALGQLSSLAVAGTVSAVTVSAATIGNVGANILGSAQYLTNISASNILGTVATAAVAASANTLTTSANAKFYPTFVNAATGNLVSYTSSNISVNPSTGNISANAFVGNVYGNILASSQTNIKTLGTLTGLTIVGDLTLIGNIYGSGKNSYNTGESVLTNSSGTGNLTITGNTVTLSNTGPGSTTVGSSKLIPVVSVDQYGRVSSLTTASIPTWTLVENLTISSPVSSQVVATTNSINYYASNYDQLLVKMTVATIGTYTMMIPTAALSNTDLYIVAALAGGSYNTVKWPDTTANVTVGYGEGVSHSTTIRIYAK